MEQINYNQLLIEEKPFADRLAIFIRDVIRPHKVLDIGCGPGHFVDSMIDVGINAMGIDIDERIGDKPYLFQQDIFSSKLVADTCICLEVVEHIDENRADDLVKQIFGMFNNTLIFSAAQPGQGGVGHINCQKPGYWSYRFEQLGATRNHLMEDLLRYYCKQGRYMGWFYNNVLVFNKKPT